MSTNTTMFSDKFAASARLSDLDVMWSIVCKIMVFSANEVFKKKWFKEFNDVFTKVSLRFHKLELLVSKIIKASRVRCAVDFASLMKLWTSLDGVKASIVQNLVNFGVESGCVCSALSGVRKSYRASKLVESQSAKEANIKSAISRRMESFEMNKDHMIRSVLERPFHKIVLNYLVVDVIMKSWTRKRRVVDNISVDWRHQYQLLEYVFDEAFSGVMCSIRYDEFFGVVSDLPDDKTAGLLGISNELWKHCDRLVLDMLLVLLNSCLSRELWKGVLTNTHPIALIETACKILSKILSDRISLACSTFDVLREDNFSSPIFAIGLVVEDALEKNRELWLVLQDMHKAYDSVGWEHLEKSLVRVKMFMTDFGLTSGYHVHDSLDQREVFFSLLWCIFYDPLLCKVKRQESICGYRLNSYFVSKNGRSESQAGFSFFFAAGAFVDNTIWVGSSQMATQHILNVASEFFHVNNISINNDKTVVIPINSRVSYPSFSINGSPIFIAKKGESPRYLSIFLLTESLLKLSLVKAHSDISFFTNLVLRKVVSDKQFLYLVSAVLHPIISYRTQFSFILVGMCDKWDALIHKGLKLKSGLPLNFPNDVVHHPLFYDLKSFLQIQSESKIASLVSFANSSGILGCLFFHRSYDLQVLCWHSVHLLSSPVCIWISASNNFLADMVRILLDCNVSLSGSLVSSFRFHGRVPMSTVLGESGFFRFLSSLWRYSIAFVDQLHDCHGAVYDWYTFKRWKRLDFRGPVPEWFKCSVLFLNDVRSSYTQSVVLGNGGFLNILEFGEYVSVCDRLLVTGAGSLSVYTDGFLSNLGTVGCRAGAAVFFKDIGLGLGINVSSLMSFTLVELQAIVLALECVPLSSSVHLFSDSQSALDACRSELGLVCPDFHNQCWVEHCHIVNLIHSKKLEVSFHKIKGHSGILGNKRADAIAGATSFSNWYLSLCLSKHFLTADGSVISGNSRHFVHDIYHSVCRAHWEVGSGSGVLVESLFSEIDWLCLSLVRPSAGMYTYFMKALHYRLPVAKCQIMCSPTRLTNLLDKVLFGSFLSSLGILQLLSSCISDLSFHKTVCIFHDPKIAVLEIVKFVHSLGIAFREDVWSVHAKHRAYIEKNRLISLDSSAVILVHGLASRFSARVVRLLGITDTLGVYFGFHKSCLFFLEKDNSVSVHIAE
ncbi:hypothetical protein G9A89_020901 [Geosiphon pyriformis]|nr:hypothetical protein G9A89_020901 [Geosiphon pyriformis]